jgi:hypothetical protein
MIDLIHNSPFKMFNPVQKSFEYLTDVTQSDSIQT